MLKKILIVIGVIILIPLVVAFFVPKEYHVERSIDIDHQKEVVFEYLRSLKNQNKWSVWAKMDPDMQSSYSGTDGQVGFVSAWNSKMENVGIGEQKITKIVEGERIEMELRFIEPFEAVSSAYFTTTEINDNQTNVVWGFDGKMDYPMNLLLLFMDIKGDIGTDFEKGLMELKNILEVKKVLDNALDDESIEVNSDSLEMMEENMMEKEDK